MSFVTRRATGRLRGLVDRLWLVEDAAPLSVPETICPDGRSELVFHLGDPMAERVGALDHAQPRHLLVGQMARPITIVPTGHIAMVGARLAPSALYRLLRIPQDRFANQILDLQTVWSRWTRQTVERVADLRDPVSKLAALERALEEIMLRDIEGDSGQALDHAVWRLQTSGGNCSIDRLAHDHGLSRRQFERRFREHVGLSPRLFGRIVRFQRAFHALGHETGASIAARCGYADQAHLVHEIRRFAGVTPTLLTDATGLTLFFRE